MDQIAVNIVLLPPVDIRDFIINISNSMINRNNDYPRLRKDDFFPHMTLAMGAIKTSDLESIKNELEKIASNHEPIRITLPNIKTKIRDDGKIAASFNVSKTKEIISIHKEVMDKMKKYFTYEGSVDMFITPPELKEIPITWVKNYHKTSVYDKYRPHITLGIGKPKEISSPIEFRSDTIALCHMGSYCTSRKIIHSEKIKKDKKN